VIGAGEALRGHLVLPPTLGLDGKHEESPGVIAVINPESGRLPLAVDREITHPCFDYAGIVDRHPHFIPRDQEMFGTGAVWGRPTDAQSSLRRGVGPETRAMASILLEPSISRVAPPSHPLQSPWFAQMSPLLRPARQHLLDRSVMVTCWIRVRPAQRDCHSRWEFAVPEVSDEK